jgi:ribose-phosphate pyrophosphokinase
LKLNFDSQKIVLLGLSANKNLTKKIANLLKIPEGKVDIKRFADGEINLRIETSVRGKEVFIIQSTSPPVNDHLMELLIAVDALKRASAKSINVIIPYFGYSRQDRKSKGREPITSKLVSDLLTVAGINRLSTVNFHSPQIQGFFDIPVDDLRCTYEIAHYLKTKKIDNLAVASPDHGGINHARRLADLLSGLPIIVIDKRRTQPNKSQIQFILGNVKDKSVVIIDDIIDTGGTIINAARALKKKGAKDIFLTCTHPVFSGEASEKLQQLLSEGIIKEVIVMDTIELPSEKKFKGLTILSIAPLINEMIMALMESRSLTAVYNSKIATFFKGIKNNGENQ